MDDGSSTASTGGGAGRRGARARRRSLPVVVAVVAVAAAALVAAPPAQAASSSDVGVTAYTSSGIVTVGTPAVLHVDVASSGPDASGPATVTVSSSGAAVTLTAPGAPVDGIGTTCAVVGSTVRCTNAGLGGDGPWWTTIAVPFTPNAAGTATLTATVSAAASDPDPGSNTSSQQVDAQVATSSDLYVLAPTLDTLVRGGEGNGEVSLQTFGPHASGPVAVHVEATGAAATLALPEGYDDGRGTTCSAAGSTIDCTVPSLSETGRWGAYAQLPLLVRPTATGAVTLSVTATGTTPDPDPLSNSASSQIDVVEAPPATLSLAAEADQQQQCSSGFDGIAVSGALSSPTGDPAYRTLLISAVPDDSSATLSASTSTDASGAYSEVVCGAAVTGYTVTVKHAGTTQAGPAQASTTVGPRATTATLVPSTTSIGYGGQLSFAATVRDATTSAVRTDAPGVAVLERRAPGTAAWTSVTPVDIGYDATGVWRPAVTATAVAEYRVRYPQRGFDALGATSAPVLVTVRAKAGLIASPHIVTPGGTVTVTGTAVPAGSAAPVLERLVRGTWTAVATRPVRSAGKATWTFRLASAGSASYRVRAPGSTTLAVGTSAAQILTATLRGKGNRKAFSFVGGTRANPARWNPCQVIGYRVNTRYARPGALADVKETLRRISQYSGLRFRYGGSTTYLPGISRGAAPAPLVIAWAPGRVDPSFRDPYLAGYASPTWYATARPRIFRAGVMLNAGLAPVAGFGSGFTRGSLLMHEIGHAVGLGHVDDPWSIMIPVNNPPGDAMYSAGDAAGLRALGRSRGCLSSLDLDAAAPVAGAVVR